MGKARQYTRNGGEIKTEDETGGNARGGGLAVGAQKKMAAGAVVAPIFPL